MNNCRNKLIDSLYAVYVLLLVRKNQEGQNLDYLIKAIKDERARLPLEGRRNFVQGVIRCRSLGSVEILQQVLQREDALITIEDLDPEKISPYPWVGDIPHHQLHGSLAQVARFLEAGGTGQADETLAKIKAMGTSSQLLSLLPVVICPARFQRSNRLSLPHNDEKGMPCLETGYFEGEGYIEDGNHRGLAQLLQGRSSLRAFKVTFSTGFLFPGEGQEANR